MAVKVWLDGDTVLIDNGTAQANTIRLQSFFFDKNDNTSEVTLRDTDDDYKLRTPSSEVQDEAGVPIGTYTQVVDFLSSLVSEGAKSSLELGTESVVRLVAESVTVVNLQVANADRKSVKITNDGNHVLYVREGAGATLSEWTWKLEKDEMAIINDYSGLITGIWDAASGGSAVITETT